MHGHGQFVPAPVFFMYYMWCRSIMELFPCLWCPINYHNSYHAIATLQWVAQRRGGRENSDMGAGKTATCMNQLLSWPRWQRLCILPHPMHVDPSITVTATQVPVNHALSWQSTTWVAGNDVGGRARRGWQEMTWVGEDDVGGRKWRGWHNYLGLTVQSKGNKLLLMT